MDSSLPFGSQLFRFSTAVDPDRIWTALTDPVRTPAYFYGLSLVSDWRPGSPVTFHRPGRPVMHGRVLRSDRPRRLGYTIGDHPDVAMVYVTWEIRRSGDLSVVRVFVDEVDPGPDAEGESEQAWLPLLSALRGALEDPAVRGS